MDFSLPIPTVTGTDPSNNAMGVDVNKTITANFSILDPLTINALLFFGDKVQSLISGDDIHRC
jgi:hypothetical protein